MTDNRYYEVPEWAVIDEVCRYDAGGDDATLEAKMVRVGEMIPEGIAACQMLANKVDHYKDAFANVVDGVCVSDEFADISDRADRLAAIQSKMENTRHAWAHVRTRLHRLIQVHGDLRALLGHDPVFRVEV